MEIKVVTGQTTFFAAKNLISKIDATSAQRHFCLVPDRFSLMIENLIMDTLNIKSTFNIEVLGLTRLAHRVLKDLGFVGQPLTADQSLLLTAQAIENVKHQFKSFKKTTISFAQEISKVISQMKSCALLPSDIKPKNCSQSVANKYHDIALIYQEYENLVGSRMDANKILALFAQEIEKSQILKDTNLYLVGFESFTTEMFSIICSLAKGAASVWIALPKAASLANAYIYEDDILTKLTSLCQAEGITVQVEEARTQITKNQQAIVENLFAGNENKIGGGYFLPLSCQSATQEVMTIGKLINLGVRQGKRFKDFVIACGDLESYMPLLRRCFAQLDIPFYADTQQTADELVLSQTIVKFLKVVSSGFSKEALCDYFSSALTQNANTGEILNAIERLNIHGKAKTYRFLSALAKSDLELFEKLCSAQNSGDICDVLQQFFDFVQARYQNFLSSLEEDYLALYNLNIQGEKYVFQALDSIKFYRAQSATSVSEFLKTFLLLVSFNQVSTVPTYVDSVMIGDVTTSYFVQEKTVFVLGGHLLPRVIQDSGLVSDQDIETLHLIRQLEPSIRVLNRRNRFKLFNLLSLASEKLVVSFRAISDDGKKIETPNFVTSLCKIFDCTPVRANFMFESMADERDDAFVAGLGSKKSADILLSSGKGKLTNRQFSALQSVLQFDLASLDLQRENLSSDAKNLFFPHGKTSVSQLECYFSCPFKHFVRYGLRLKEAEQFGAKEIGNVCHKMAENFVRENVQSLADFSEKDVEKYVLANIHAVLHDLEIDKTLEVMDEQEFVVSYLIRQCVAVLNRICYEQKNSLFRPKFLEKQLEGASLTIGDGPQKLALSGKVDRIDVYGDTFRVLDYKTGKVAPLIKDLFYGDKLQLFIYQKGICQMLNLSCGGVFYFDCKFDFSDAQSALLKGLVKDDDEVIAASDKRLGVQNQSDIIAVSVRKEEKKGRFKGSAICKSSLLNLEEYAHKVAQKALEQIVDGFVRPMPDADACEFCAYKSICLYSKTDGVRKKDKISEKDITDALKGGQDE